MAGETFKLNFITNGEGFFDISEPFGFDSADFVLKQDTKRYGRDVSFSGGEQEFTFSPMREHQFDLLMYYYETFGWESQVELIITKDGIEHAIGDFDFYNAKTDQLTYFTCKVIQQSSQAIIKRRDDVTVDVFSDENIDGEAIEPLESENVLVKAKPITQYSSWETPSLFEKSFEAESSSIIGTNTSYYAFNPSRNLTSYGIDDSLTFLNVIEPKALFKDRPPINYDNFKIIEAANNLSKINITISNLDLKIETSEENGNGYVDVRLEVAYGEDYDSSEKYIFFSEKTIRENRTYENKNSYSFEIPYLERGKSAWLYIHYKVRQSKTGLGKFIAYTEVASMDVDISASSVSYSTIVPSIRLKDGVSQVVKSISGLSTSFPFAEKNGEMYDQRLFSGNMLRNLDDKPFYLSFKDITDWLPEINGDYEIQPDGKVYFGLYKSFYKNTEMMRFDSVAFDSYNKSFNDKYAINEFYYKYKKYQSQKETEVENTFDVVHGESEWSVLNNFVENTKDVSVTFVRDSFYIDEQRRKGLDLSETTSTQDDDTVFILDTKEATEDSAFKETDYLQHTFDTDTSYLKLSNTGTFSFVLLGMTVGDSFKILGDDTNAGNYEIVEVSERYIVINNGSGSESRNGDRNTYFEYIVNTQTAPYVSWSNEGFSYIDGIISSDNYANLKYSIKQNIVKFYNEYLATANLFAKSPIKNTEYTSNYNLALGYNGIETVEGDDFTPTSPILSPYKHMITVITDFNTYKELEYKARTERGYIVASDNERHFVKMYPSEMTFVNSGARGELTIVGEEKYERSLIDIAYTNLEYVVINKEYRTRKIKYKVIDEKFYIFDELGKQLYNPVFWHKISVNGASPDSKETLEEWLQLIS